jgi:diadenosine tetraphosphate (Ap4A) HIT family hydrolase
MDLEDEDRSVLFPKLTEAISELKKDMGEDEYNEFIRRGREMFQPKK